MVPVRIFANQSRASVVLRSAKLARSSRLSAMSRLTSLSFNFLQSGRTELTCCDAATIFGAERVSKTIDGTVP